MTRIEKRVVLHFPGFEPLDAAAHRARYERSARQSAAAWHYSAEVGPIEDFGAAPFFDVRTAGNGWQTRSRIHVLDHNDIVRTLNGRNLLARLAMGYIAALRVAFGGGLTGYFRHAWRFGLFFVFPFLLILAGLLLSVLIVQVPLAFGLPDWLLVVTVPVAIAFFVCLYKPQSDRLHTMHLFSDWELAVAMAGSNDPRVEKWLSACADSARLAFNEPANEYLVSSHSMGSSAAAHVIGLLLEREPDLFVGKRVVFTTLGSAILQCALLRSASLLRARVGLIARCRQIFWSDVHCLTDAIHFYKTKVAAVCGHADAPQATIIYVRFKTMLSAEHYGRIKLDFLRMHRQYVLGPDRQASFDFTLATAGPLPTANFANFTQSKMPVL